MNNNVKTNSEIQNYLSIVEGVTQLFYPYVEGAVHDLTNGKIVAIFNNISKRKIGDASPLKELNLPIEKFPDVFEPYYKENWDGKKLKCTSITIRDKKGNAIGLICFNYDTSFFHDISNHLNQFLNIGKTIPNPVEQFTDNWQEQVDSFITKYLNTNNTITDNLTKEQKAQLVKELYIHGLFNFKNAAVYVAKKLKTSRATIYNYLKN